MRMRIESSSMRTLRRCFVRRSGENALSRVVFVKLSELALVSLNAMINAMGVMNLVTCCSAILLVQMKLLVAR